MILVTGAAGFIGSHVMVSLLKEDVSVIGVDNFENERNYLLNVSAVDAYASGHDDNLRLLDLREYQMVERLLQNYKPDAVIHLAAKVGVRDSLLDPRGYLETNVIGTQNLLDACQKAGVKQVVLASTSSVYGNTEHQVETALPQPRSPYAASKLGMEALGRVYHELYGMNVAILRLFSVYGERVRPDLMISQIMHSIVTGKPITLFNNGLLRRDWTYVGDVVNGIRAALTLQGCEVINIGRGENFSLLSVLAYLEDQSGRAAFTVNAPAPLTEPTETWADISKAQHLLGYVPKISVKEGLRRTWAWYETAHAQASKMYGNLA